MLSTPQAKPTAAKPRRAASSSGMPACMVKEKARPLASTHWMRSATGGPGCSIRRIVQPVDFILDAFSSREPVPTSLENAFPAISASSPRASSSSRTIRFGTLP